MKTAKSWADEAKWGRVPEVLREEITEYILRGKKPRLFLQGVITNDLRLACLQVDGPLGKTLYDVTMFFVAWAPIHSWGSKENMEAWDGLLDAGGGDGVDG